METKINITTILKNKPKGTKLYSTVHGKCTFEAITDEIFKINFCTSKFGLTQSGECILIKFGNMFDDGECVIFPSKEMQDWSKFQWEKGDVLISNDGGTEVIFDKWYDDTYTNFYGKHYLNSEDKNNIKYSENLLCTTERYSLENKNTAQTYINIIEKHLGGKLNFETLVVEKHQPEFKDGDIAFADYGNRQDVFIVSDKTNLSEGYSSFISLDLSSLTLSMGYRTCFFKKDLCKLRLATDSEKKQLFSALEKEGKIWDAEKKMIVNLKPKVELKPFDNVLVRHQKTEEWRANIFSHTDKTDEYLDYVCVNGRWEFCIPYEGNESLLGTTKDVED
jgi:hypothetical protein|nr:MAG: hypothetical protein [Bacteriophage sp.]